MGYSCRTFLWGHSCRTLLWDALVGHTLRTRLPPKVTLRRCKTSVSYETSSKSHASSLKKERFVRDFLQKSHVKSPKRAFRPRLPPKVTCQVPKASVSYETSSKTHISKSAKRTLRTRLPPKVQRKHPSEHTHHAALPSSFAIPAPPINTRSHANPNVRHSPLPQLTTCTIPCACHENRTSTPQNPHKVLRLPRNVNTTRCADYVNSTSGAIRLAFDLLPGLKSFFQGCKEGN